MLLTGLVGLAAVVLLVYTALRLRPDLVEWSVYVFLLGLAIMPSRIRNEELLPNSTLSALDLYIWTFLAYFFVVRAVRPRPKPVAEIVIGIPLGLFCSWAFITGALAGYPGYFWAVGTALVHWVPAFLACWIGVSILPRSVDGFKRLEAYFKALAGLVIAPQVILTAFNLGGWETYASQEGGDFLRGWSCIGSGIVTAACILPAYLFAVRDFFNLRGNQSWNVALAAMIFLAILFTLARSVMALLIIGSISLTIHYSQRSLTQLATFVAIALVFAVVLWITMSQLSFSRLTSTRDRSTDLRLESVLGALSSGWEQPIWGHGFGCLYDQVRAEGSSRDERDTIDVAGHESALEPHNAYALCWAETGIIGLTLFVSLLMGFRHHMPFFYKDPNVDDHTERTVWWIMVTFFLSASGLLLYQIPAVFLTLSFMLVFFSTSLGATRLP